MKCLVLPLLFLSLFSAAQKKNSVSLSFDFTLPKGIGPGYGASVSGNTKVAGPIYAGIGIGVMKFKNLMNYAVPLFGKITVAPKVSGKLAPIFFIEPGLLAHNTKSPDRFGSLTLSSGAGIQLPSTSRSRTYFTIGYVYYQYRNPLPPRFSDHQTKFTHSGLALRAGRTF